MNGIIFDLKSFRSNQLNGMSQEEFGRRLGVTRGAITNIELNKVEPKPLFVNLIVREFGVSEKWLRTGEGDMFASLDRRKKIAAFLGDLMREEEDGFKTRFIEMISSMTPEEWALMEKMARKLTGE